MPSQKPHTLTEHAPPALHRGRAILSTSDTAGDPYALVAGHTFGNVDIHGQASVHLGDKYLQQIIYAGKGDSVVSEKLVTKLEVQERTMGSIRDSLYPLLQESNKTHTAISSLTKASAKHTAVLTGLQQMLTDMSVNATTESITFVDALNRRYRLPFVYFNNWQVRCVPMRTPQVH